MKATKKRKAETDHIEQPDTKKARTYALFVQEWLEIFPSCNQIFTNPGTKQPLTLIARLLGKKVKKVAVKFKVSKVPTPDTAQEARAVTEAVQAEEVKVVAEVGQGRLIKHCGGRGGDVGAR